MRHLFIRADASAAIGSGHIMRCLALAQAWQERGGNVTFLSHCQNKVLRQRLTKEGYEFVFVERSHPDPADLKQVIECSRKVLNGSDKLWFVVDGYHFDPDYQKSIRELGYKLVVIDDYNHLPAYHADILLNQNIGAEQFPYRCGSKTVKLFGPQYALLRTEFLAWRNSARKKSGGQIRIMVTLGGSDPDNITLKVLKALCHMSLSGYIADVIAGPTNPNIKKLSLEIQHIQKSSVNTIKLHQNINMPEIMAVTDVAISAGGSTCWELCFFGIPSLLIIAAENQQSIAVGLEREGAAACLGWHQDIDPVQLSSTLNGILSDAHHLKSMSLQAKKIIDGNGRNRLMNLMDWIKAAGNVKHFSLRKAELKDAFQLWKLANDSDVRHNAFNTAPIGYENHAKWLNAKLDSDMTVIYVLDISGVIVAQIRYDKKENAAEIDYAVNPSFRGNRIGTRILEMTWKRACKELGVQRVQGIVKKDNKFSICSFQRSGFKKLKHNKYSGYDCILFERRLN